MPYLVAAVALIGVLALVNLLLTFGLVRRIREQESTGGTHRRGSESPMRVAVGDTVEAFAATTADGESLTSDQLSSGTTLVGFFSPGCTACTEQIPTFLKAAAQTPGGRAQVLAVVTSEAGSEVLVDTLSPAARVVIEVPGGGAVARAFGVWAFPAFGLLTSDRTLMAVANGPGHLPVAVVA